MAYKSIIWKDRQSEFPNRRLMKIVEELDGATIVDVERTEGVVNTPGNRFDAKTMNDLEKRIAAGFGDIDTLIAETQKSLQSSVDTVRAAIPQKGHNFTVLSKHWETYNNYGETHYRQLLNFPGITNSMRVDLVMDNFYKDKLFAMPTCINLNGLVYITTSIKPSIDISGQIYLIPVSI